MTAHRLVVVSLALGLSVFGSGCGGGSAQRAAVQLPSPTLAPVESTAVPAATAITSAPAAGASDPAAAELSRAEVDLGSLDSSIAAVDQARSQNDG